MLCESCGKRQATTHIKTVINGALTEKHLCSECAKEKGYGGLLTDWGSGFGTMLGGFFGNIHGENDILRCESCGTSFEDITRSGKLGCADCYSTFRQRLTPMIQRIHGTVQHKGKRPGGSALRLTDQNHQIMPVKEDLLEEKKRLLKRAVEEQDFEHAAVLRDEIREMEGGRS